MSRQQKQKQKQKAKGRRYSDAEKKKILEHVYKVNSERGRGGIASAAKKFGVTPLTISNWMRSVGSGPAPRTGRRADTSGTLRRLAELHDEIAGRERELTALRREFQKLKNRL